MQKKNLILSILTILILTVSPTQSEAASITESLSRRQQGQALKLYNSAAAGDSQSLAELKERANKGERWAAMQYGYMAHTGKLPGLNGKPNYALAHKAYNLAVKVVSPEGKILNYNGNHIAAYNLGLMYYYGNGVSRNPAEALRWFVISANEENPLTGVKRFYPGAIYAARIYTNGIGVKKDTTRGFYYWNQAASIGDATAKYELGRMLYLGIGTEKDEFKAIKNLQEASYRFNVDAMYFYAQVLMEETRFKKSNPPEAARLLLIAGVKRPQYHKYADQILAQLPESQREQITKSAANWIRMHSEKYQEFDFKKPLNDEPPKRR